MTENTVIVSAEGGIVELTLNRPKQLNALNRDMIRSLNEIVGSFENDPSIRCVVIKGAGDHFMAGGDIGYFYELLDLDTNGRVEALRRLIATVHQFVCSTAELPVPVIASVHGAAAGFGISLVAGCDLAIASDTSFFTSAYTFLGTSPDGGSTYYLPKSVGMKKAMEIVLLSERLSAQAALEMGLINTVVEKSQLAAETEKAAQMIARSPRLAVTNAKRLIRRSYRNDLQEQLNLELEFFLQCAASKDFAEGVRAFMEKRKPRFEA